MAIENEDVLKDFTKKLIMDILNDIKNDLYKKAVKSDSIRPVYIRDNIKMPEYVYKYKSFNINYYESCLNGDICFSNTANFNSNDPNDSKIYINKNKILEYFDKDTIFKNLLIKSKIIPESHNVKKAVSYSIMEQDERMKHRIFKRYYNFFVKTTRNRSKVTCFTTCSYDVKKNSMWLKKDFGDDGKGFCIKYRVDKENFYPDTIMFLKVLYETHTVPETGEIFEYDFTDNIINTIASLSTKCKMNEYLRKDKCRGVFDNEFDRYLDRYIELINRVNSTSYNYILHKKEMFSGEKEWRIIVPVNRWEQYFDDIKKENKDEEIKNFKSCIEANFPEIKSNKDRRIKNFKNSIASICLGPECNKENVKNYKQKYEYALEKCKEYKIPFYRAVDTGNEDHYELEEIYTPEKE